MSFMVYFNKNILKQEGKLKIIAVYNIRVLMRGIIENN